VIALLGSDHEVWLHRLFALVTAARRLRSPSMGRKSCESFQRGSTRPIRRFVPTTTRRGCP
jgi:hypothetical protein